MSDGGRLPGKPGPRLRFEEDGARGNTPITSGQNVQRSKRHRMADFHIAPAHTEPPRDAPGNAPRFENEDAPPSRNDDPVSSGQNVQRSRYRKFKRDSEQARPSERLRQDKDEAPPPGGDGPAPSVDGAKPRNKKAAYDAEKLNKSKLRTEKTGSKLDAARDKLSEQKPPKKSGPVKAVGREARRQAWAYTHKKIYEVEHENIGIEAAHRTELAGEKVVRGTSRFIKRQIRTHPARRVRKWERKDIKARADYAFRTTAQENPELNKNARSRYFQKRKIKKQYQKQARKAAKQGARAAEKTAVTTGKIARAAVTFVRRNPRIIIITLCAFLFVVILQSCMAALSTLGNGIVGVVGGTSYLAEDADIDNAELAYTEWQVDLQIEIQNAASTHPGFDEYRYNVGEISHNPYELMAFLTAVYDDFTYSEVEGVLREVFNEQYILSYVAETEIRYRTETYTDPETGESYTEEVAYEWHILNVNLTAQSFSNVVFFRMDAEQRQRFNVYMATKGNRQYLASPFGELNWLPYVSSYYGYRIHPISGEKNYHMGLDIGMPTGTDILAGQYGMVTFAGDSGGYGLVVVLDDGAGLVSKYAHCSVLLVSAGQTVQTGDVIAKVGNTGNSTGPHLHLEIIKDGQYLNPLYFAITNDYGTGPTYGDPGAAMGDGSYAAMIAEAEKYLGYPYVWGGSTPATSFDCSGFVCWVINQSGVGSVGRTTAQGLYNLCTPVSPADAKPGDLIFFSGTYSTTDTVTHVGLYVGGDMMLHCGNPIGYVNYVTRYGSHFFSFGRLP